MINLPNSQTRQWKQANNSDLFGNLSVTKNINFDREGYLSLSNASKAAMHSTIDAQFDVPADMVYEDAHNFLIATWDQVFNASYNILETYPVQNSDSGVPSTDIEGDTTLFNQKVVVSQDTDVDYYDITTSTWVDTDITLTAGGQHPVVNFLSTASCAIANKTTVGLYAAPLTSSPTLITTLTLQSDFEITSMCYLNQNLYVATRHIYGGNAYLFVWNGQGTAAQQAYKVDSNIIFSVAVHKGSVVLLTGQGELLAFNGGGFTQLATLPIFYTVQTLTDSLNKTLYRNIMKSNGDVLYIMVSQSRLDQKLLNQPDGIWCYDEKVGLYHKYSLSNSLVDIKPITTANVNTTTDQITVSSPAHPTGTELIFLANGTAIGGLVDERKYFVINIDSTHIQLAETKADAENGTYIDLTSTGTIGQTFNYFPNIDYGAFLTNRMMSLLTIDAIVGSNKYGEDLLWGGEVNLRQLTGDDGFLGTTTPAVEARGYFITPKILSENVTDNFNLLTLKWLPFTNELDKIIIKYRTVDDRRDVLDLSAGMSAWKANWTSSTTFTTTQTDFSEAIVGDEVEFLMGAAGGLLAHITEISENSGTYTVTIDEEFTAYITGDVSTFVFRNWKKFATITGDNTDYFLSKNLDAKGKFVQVKVELRGIGVAIEELKIDNKYLLPATK